MHRLFCCLARRTFHPTTSAQSTRSHTLRPRLSLHGPSFSTHLVMSALPSPLNVLVTGYGRVGQHILDALTKPEYASSGSTPQVKTFLLARPASLADPSKRVSIDQYAAKGVTIVEGDLAQGAAALTLLLRHHSIHTVVSVVGGGPQVDLQLGLLEAAKAAGVLSFIPSDFGSDYDSITSHSPVYGMIAKPKLAIHEAVKKSGLEYTLIANGWFAEILYGMPVMGVDTKTRTVTAPMSFDTVTTVTALADVGRLTAAAIVDPTTRNKQLYFGRQYTYEQIAQALEQATGEKVTRKVRSKEEMEAAVASSPSDIATRFVLSLAHTGNSFPNTTTYKHGQYDYIPLEQVARKVISASKPAQ